MHYQGKRSVCRGQSEHSVNHTGTVWQVGIAVNHVCIGTKYLARIPPYWAKTSSWWLEGDWAGKSGICGLCYRKTREVKPAEPNRHWQDARNALVFAFILITWSFGQSIVLVSRTNWCHILALEWGRTYVKLEFIENYPLWWKRTYFHIIAGNVTQCIYLLEMCIAYERTFL